jgi:signal transduction histidine kinase
VNSLKTLIAKEHIEDTKLNPIDNISKLKRYFHIFGFSSTIIAAIILVMFYRITAISDIVELGERNNLLQAKTVLNSVKKELIQFTAIKQTQQNIYSDKSPLPENLSRAIKKILTDTTVARIKIYNRQGTIIFSTKTSQIGKKGSMSKEFLSAINGRVASKLIYYDSLSIFRKSSDDDNLLQSYLPIRWDVTTPVHGVFEVYTDVSFITNRIERTEAIILLGVFFILFLLYSFQAIIIHFSSRTIEKQQSIIHERTQTLELLSTQMLNAQEAEKKRISNLLHEDLAQTLSIIKNNIEIEHSKQLEENPDKIKKTLPQSIQLIQQAIHQIRTLSIELRPPSLDDFGLVKTIEALCDEYQRLYPDLTIKKSFILSKEKLQTSLNILIYRVIQEAMSSVMNSNADSISLQLHKEDKKITLSIEDNSFSYHKKSYSPEKDAITATINIYSAMKERTILSGGTFTINSNQKGKTTAMACWDIE